MGPRPLTTSAQEAKQEAEAKRWRRSAKTNARKSAKQKRARFQRKEEEVIKLLTKGKFTKDMKKEGNTICLQDINKTGQLVARFHSKAMCFDYRRKLLCQRCPKFCQ
jgi:hypothetical protein